MKKKIGLFLGVILVFAFFSCQEPYDYEKEIKVTVINFPDEKTFPAPVSVVATDEPGGSKFRLTFSIVPGAVSYQFYAKDTRGFYINFTPQDKIKSTENGSSTLYALFLVSDIDELLKDGQQSYGVAAVSIEGISSPIKWSR
jgi:hypothetical protein